MQAAVDFGQIRDRERIEAFLRKDAGSHVYALADLDEFFWPDTTWYAAYRDDEVVALCLLLRKLDPVVLYAVAPPEHQPTHALLQAIRSELPERFFVNLGLGLQDVFADHEQDSEGEFCKLQLMRPCTREPVARVEPLRPEHLGELREFYRTRAYAPEEADSRFFEPYMLEIGPFFGIRCNGQLVAAGGGHAVSRFYKVAALGNIATSPDHRRQGLARDVTIALCRALQPHTELIGLNVHSANRAAIGCYEQLGFRDVRRYIEGTYQRKAA